MEIHVDGVFIVARLMQLANAKSPIDSIPSGMITSFKDATPAKA